MNSLELLNVLDVIKNEEVYNKRLKQLKEHQAKLDESQFIVASVEQAQKINEKAKERENKAKELVASLEHDIRQAKLEVEKDLQNQEHKLRLKEAEAEKIVADAKRLANESKEAKALAEKKIAEFEKYQQDYFARDAELQKLKTFYFNTIYEIRLLINKEP